MKDRKETNWGIWEQLKVDLIIYLVDVLSTFLKFLYAEVNRWQVSQI